MRKRVFWTEQMQKELVQRYSNTLAKDLADKFNVSLSSLYNKAQRMGLKKDKEFIADRSSINSKKIKSIKKNQFKKGHIPWNKGKKIGSHPNSIATQFKKGNKPLTWAPLGTVRYSKDGYIQVKCFDTGNSRHDFVFIHRKIWEKHNGPIPEGHVVSFKDKNPNNLDINNLELISRAEQMKRNSLHNYPKEIAQLVQLRGQLNRQINKKKGRK